MNLSNTSRIVSILFATATSLLADSTQMTTVGISGGQDHALALRSDGSVWSWGTNQIGQMGNAVSNSPFPVRVSGVTNAIGIHSGANPVSGEFSVGISGLLIEAGRVGQPVREVTMAGDIVSMLRSIVALGDDARWVPSGSILTPSVAIEGVSIGGA